MDNTTQQNQPQQQAQEIRSQLLNLTRLQTSEGFIEAAEQRVAQLMGQFDVLWDKLAHAIKQGESEEQQRQIFEEISQSVRVINLEHLMHSIYQQIDPVEQAEQSLEVSPDMTSPLVLASIMMESDQVSDEEVDIEIQRTNMANAALILRHPELMTLSVLLEITERVILEIASQGRGIEYKYASPQQLWEFIVINPRIKGEYDMNALREQYPDEQDLKSALCDILNSGRSERRRKLSQAIYLSAEQHGIVLTIAEQLLAQLNANILDKYIDQILEILFPDYQPGIMERPGNESLHIVLQDLRNKAIAFILDKLDQAGLGE